MRDRLERELGVGGMTFDPLGYLDDSTAIAPECLGAIVIRLDPCDAAPALDTVPAAARVPSGSATVNPAVGEPAGAPVLWVTDPRFSDASGWSNVPSHGGGILHVQRPEQVSPGDFRVMPNWVATMMRAGEEGIR